MATPGLAEAGLGAGAAPRHATFLRSLVLVRAPELARQGLRQLSAYRLRTALALAGIVVGVMAVTGSMALLSGVEAMIRDSFDRFFGGDRAGILRGQTEAWKAGRRYPLQKIFAVGTEDRQALATLVPEIECLSPSSAEPASVAAGRIRVEGLRVIGVGPDFTRIRRYTLISGRFVSAEDEASRARVAVLFDGLANDLFGRTDVIGEEVRLDGQRFTVVGVLRRFGKGNADFFRQVLIPHETAIARLGRDPMRSSTWAKVRPGERFDALGPAFLSVLVGRHPGATADNFRVFPFSRLQDRQLRSAQTSGRILNAVALLCLAAGGIGIFNVLLISVTERTREIGLRLALGATRLGILSQFLFESALLCLIGGGIGIAAARGFAALLAGQVQKRFVDGMIDPALLAVRLGPAPVLTGLGLALATALVAGVYPAWRASKVDPAECLRRE